MLFIVQRMQSVKIWNMLPATWKLIRSRRIVIIAYLKTVRNMLRTWVKSGMYSIHGSNPIGKRKELQIYLAGLKWLPPLLARFHQKWQYILNTTDNSPTWDLYVSLVDNSLSTMKNVNQTIDFDWNAINKPCHFFWHNI